MSLINRWRTFVHRREVRAVRRRTDRLMNKRRYDTLRATTK